MASATPPPTSPTQQQPNPLRIQYSSKRALLASIEANKRAISVIERQETEIQKRLEDTRYEKKINLTLWEKHRGGKGKDEGEK
ncbi:MAG: hypothetical protein M1813_007893 [Trichoglossum hirsutum]|nr:MAG: hypothetical protein M1813_007893 [Trichoglossum hirsutum]